MDVFKLAELQLQRERKNNSKNKIHLLFDRADTIQKFFSHSDRKKFKQNSLVKIDNI